MPVVPEQKAGMQYLSAVWVGREALKDIYKYAIMVFRTKLLKISGSSFRYRYDRPLAVWRMLRRLVRAD